MLRQVSKLAPSTGRTALHTYSTETKLIACAVAPIRTIGCTPLFTFAPCHTTVAAVSSCFTLAPRRWSSSKTESHAPIEATNAHMKQSVPPPPTPTNLTAAAAPVEGTPSTHPSLEEKISALSADDQERILAALRQPEKQKSSVMGGAGIGPADGDMLAAFTCGPCNYRMVKRFSKHAYTKGIVIVECPNCLAKHLLADNLGWLEDEAKNIEDILREKGERFTRIGGTSGDFQAVGDAEVADEAAATAAPAGGVAGTTAQE